MSVVEITVMIFLEVAEAMSDLSGFFKSSNTSTSSTGTGPTTLPPIGEYYAFIETSNPNYGFGKYGIATYTQHENIKGIKFSVMHPLEVLERYWNYTSFRPLQEAIINSVIENNDTFVLLPTGGGKSLCYQLPALMKEGTAIVVVIILTIDLIYNHLFPFLFENDELHFYI